MAKRDEVVGFIVGWAATNCHAGGYKAEGDLVEASRLAERCVALAAAQQISRADMEAEVGDLGEHMRRALNIAQGASEVPRNPHPSRAKAS